MIKKFLSLYANNKAFFLGLFLLFLYCLPLILVGEKIFILGHDNLDGELVHRLLVARSKSLFSISQNALIDQIMNGIPRASLPSGFNITVILYSLVKPFWAYAINDIIVRLIGYVGMYCLLRRYVLPDRGSKIISAGVALSFSFLPYYSVYGAIISAQPLLVYAFLNIFYRKPTYADYVVIALFPFYSSLVWSYSVFLALGLMLAGMSLKHRRFEPRVFIWLVIMFLLSIIADLPLLIQTFFNHSYVSHRQEFNLFVLSARGNEIPHNIFANLIEGQYHAASLHKLILFLFLPIAFLLGLWRNKRDLRLVTGLLFVALYISIFYGFYGSEYFIFFKEKINFLKTFQLDRFYFLQATIWYVAFALSLKYISALKRFGSHLAVVAILVQVGFIFSNTPGFYLNALNTARVIAGREPARSLTIPPVRGKILPAAKEVYPFYSDYYSAPLFNQMRDYINLPQADYRVISIGMEPEIAQYNGFYTLDSYQPDYPLAYKHEFRQVIARELAKDQSKQIYFDSWGSRCYAFVNSDNPDLDYAKLKQMGGKYIISYIELSSNQNLVLEKVFTDFYQFYLYRIV